MTALLFKSGLQLGRMLRGRKISATELLAETATQYARHNAAINAVIFTDFEAAKRAAKASDRRLSRGKPLSPFDGVPMTIKESFDWAGLPSTWGDPALANNIATTDAVVLTKMRQAGAVAYGKTNVPLALSDWQSFNAIYGTTNNPWNTSRTPGGSSGGAAAALASGMAALEIGSDIGASIRNPAHYCGVFGHKPTYGVVPYRGHLMPGSVALSDITVAGPMARSAKDLTAMMKLLVGSEGIEARSLQIRLPVAQQKSMRQFRVAIKLSSAVSDVDVGYQKQLLALADFLRKKTKKLSLEAVPDFADAEAYENYITLLRATATKRMGDDEIEAAARRGRDFGEADKSYVAIMNRALGMTHGAWLKANERRHQLRRVWDAFFQDWDVLLCPCAASAAWPHDQVGERHERVIPVNGKMVSTIDQRFWAGYSCNFYLPSTVAPLGLSEEGLPLGVQIITREYGDYTALRFAEFLEKEWRSFVAPSGF
jgi:amidase